MVSSYRGHPILYSHLKWNHFTAAFLRYGTLIHLQGYKDTISNKYTKLMVSSFMGHPILYAHLIWKHITAAFLRYGTLIHFEDYKYTISNKYTKRMVSSYMGHPILYALLIWNVSVTYVTLVPWRRERRRHVGWPTNWDLARETYPLRV